MAWDDSTRTQHRRLCSFAYTFAQIADQSIFGHITDRTTPEQVQAAQHSLLQLCQRLEAQMDMFHYPAATGMHSCVRDIYTDAAFRLKNLVLLQPAPPPQLAPRKQPLTPEEVVNNLEQALQTSPKETFLGRNDQTSTNETDR
jgi:hypothetical protein